MSGTVVRPPLKAAHADDFHEEYGLLMSMALDQMLDADQQEALDRHLMSCRACSRQWQLWQTIDHQFQLAPKVLPPTDFAQQVEMRLQSQEKSRELRVGIVLAFLTLVLWAIGFAGVGVLLGFLAYNQIGLLSEILHWLAYGWTMLRILGESVGRAIIGLGDSPSAVGALFGYVALAVTSLAAWTQFLRRSIRPWDGRSV